MPNKKNNIDNLFHKGLTGNEVKPPAHAWARIENELLLEERKKDKKRIFFLIWATAASIALFISLGSYLWNIRDENNHLKQEIALISQREQETNNASVKNNAINPVEQMSNGVNKSGTGDNQKENVDVNKPSEKVTYKNRNDGIVEEWSNANPSNIPLFHYSALSDTQVMRDALTSFEKKTVLNTDTVIKDDNISLINPTPNVAQTVHIKDTFYAKTIINDAIEKNTRAQWWIGGIYSPDYAYQNLSPASNTNNANAVKDLYTNASKAKYSFTIGMQVGYQLNEKWFIQTGFMYADKGEKTDYALVNTSTASSNIMTSTAILDSTVSVFTWSSGTTNASNGTLATGTNSPQPLINRDYTVNYKYEYFDIPLLIKYHIRNGKLSYFVLSGFSTNFFFRHQVVVESIASGSKQTTTENPAPFKSINYSAMAGIGIDYSFSKKISVNLEPTFRRAFTSTVKNSIINTYPYSLGLVTGLKYHF